MDFHLEAPNVKKSISNVPYCIDLCRDNVFPIYSPKQHNVSCTAIETLSKSLETMDKCAEIFSETTFSHIAFAISHRQSYIAYIPDRKSGNKKKERKKT